MKGKQTNWRNIEKALNGLTTSQLIDLLEEQYYLSEDVQLFLDSKILKKSQSQKEYRAKIYKALSADIQYDEELDWDAASKAVKDYSIATGDDEGIADLLVYVVEIANKFTLDYGDIDEDYYESVEGSFQKAVDHIMRMQNKGIEVEVLIKRLHDVVESTSNIGWGYHDCLSDMYVEAFGS